MSVTWVLSPLGWLYRLARVLRKPDLLCASNQSSRGSSGGTWILGSQDLGSVHQLLVETSGQFQFAPSVSASHLECRGLMVSGCQAPSPS